MLRLETFYYWDFFIKLYVIFSIFLSGECILHPFYSIDLSQVPAIQCKKLLVPCVVLCCHYVFVLFLYMLASVLCVKRSCVSHGFVI